MIRILKAQFIQHPVLEVHFSDGAERQYDVTRLFPTWPPARQLADPDFAASFRLGNRGLSLEWPNDIELDVLNLRYYKDDLHLHEWKDVPDSVSLQERINRCRSRRRVTIDLSREVTPATYAALKGLSVQAVMNQVRRGKLKEVRTIPELNLTLIRLKD